MAMKIIAKLGIDAEQKHAFLHSLAQKHESRGMKRESVAFQEFREKLAETRRAATEYSFIAPPADWYYNAIQELTFVEGAKSDPKWIAMRLGISESEVQSAIDKLVVMKALYYDGNGHLKKCVEKTRGHPDGLKPHVSAQVIELHRQLLERASRSVTDDAIEVRNARGLTFAFDPDRLPEARELLARFAREMSEFAAQGPRKKVYQFELVLFPLERQREHQ